MTLNAAQVGFGAAVLAGLILAVIGHPGPQGPMPVATSAPASASAPQTFALKSVSVDLPTKAPWLRSSTICRRPWARSD
jgi:hypothetical protein